MKVGISFSGGKDSCYALYKAMQENEVVCLISVISKNPESYMFHTPNIKLTKLQAKAIGLPLITQNTLGEKEKELMDLEKVLEMVKEKFKIKGVVTGAIESNYQKSRVEEICNKLELKCFNPLWHKDPLKYWEEVLNAGFEIIISSVSAEGLDKTWLGKKMDSQKLEKLKNLSKKYKFHLGFEGGEAETFVLNAPFFEKRIEIKESSISFEKNSGILKIKKAMLVGK